MFLEYDPAFMCYRPRLGLIFTDVMGRRYFDTLKEARETLARCGLALGKKTDTRTWTIIASGPGACIL